MCWNVCVWKGEGGGGGGGRLVKHVHAADVLNSPLRVLVEFLQLLYRAYSDLYFTYLEINPLGKYIFLRPHSVISSFLSLCSDQGQHSVCAGPSCKVGFHCRVCLQGSLGRH